MKKINIFIIFFGFSLSVFGQDDKDINEQCKLLYPSITQLFKKNQCITDAKNSEKREEEARPCLAKQIPVLEEKLKTMAKDIAPNDSVEVASEKLSKVTGKKSAIAPSDDNIKNMVAINWLTSNCASNFYYLINVVQGEDARVKAFEVWTVNPPKGYTNNSKYGYRPEFYVDYVAKRKAADKPKQTLDERRSNSSIDSKSHCESGISLQERKLRLAKNGEVHYSSSRTFRAGNHGFGIFEDNTLTYCF